MTQLAIIGYKTRGKEVIELLEMFGYVNYHKYSADCELGIAEAFLFSYENYA